MRDRTDGELMQLVLAKNRAAFEQLYDRYVKLVYSFALKSVKREQAAREIVQHVFTRLWTTESGYDASKGQFVNWLLTITRNMTIDYLRKERRHDAAVPIEPERWAKLPDELILDPEQSFAHSWIRVDSAVRQPGGFDRTRLLARVYAG
jgi:RNA polymerase sigma-70 factor (ECF subfamily)